MTGKTSPLIIVMLFLVAAVATYSYSQRSHYSSKHPLLDQVRANFGKLDPKHMEIPLRSGDSAFTENKEVITLCLTDPETKKDYDINTIMYVALHELAHVVSSTVGHGKIFKENFSKLLKRGAELGFYDPRKPIPSNYCGVKTGSH